MSLKKLCLIMTALTVSAASAQTAPDSAQTVPHSSHVWVVAEENHSFEDVVGNPQMPYYNQLIQQYGLAAQFYSDQHSSLPALMWFVAGAAIDTNNDTTSCQHTQDNVVRELLNQGYTWRSYQVDLPYPGYQGLYGGEDSTYLRRHNPLIDFSDTCPGTGQDINSVPFTQMATDFAQGNTVNYAFVTPNVNEDAHNGTVQQADQWLQTNLPTILARPEFGPGGDGLLFVVWDEATLDTDNRCSSTLSQGCGGRTATLVIGPQVRPGYQSNINYKNENVLSTICAAMGLSPCPGAAQTAAPMTDFFTGNAANSANGVTIQSPGNGSTIVGEVHLLATATEDQTISQTQVWDNNVKLGIYPGNVDAIYNLAPGQHNTTVLDLDSSYKILHQASVSYNVQAATGGVQITAPVQSSTLSSTTVQVVAQANESVPVSQMQVWDNGTKLGWYATSTLNQYFNLTPGPHTLTVLDLDSKYNLLHQAAISYTVQSLAGGVAITSPTANLLVSNSAVQVIAAASESVPVNQMQVWDNGVKLGWYPGSSVNQLYTLSPGIHILTVLDLDNTYKPLHLSTVTYIIQ